MGSILCDKWTKNINCVIKEELTKWETNHCKIQQFCLFRLQPIYYLLVFWHVWSEFINIFVLVLFFLHVTRILPNREALIKQPNGDDLILIEVCVLFNQCYNLVESHSFFLVNKAFFMANINLLIKCCRLENGHAWSLRKFNSPNESANNRNEYHQMKLERNEKLLPKFGRCM